MLCADERMTTSLRDRICLAEKRFDELGRACHAGIIAHGRRERVCAPAPPGSSRARATGIRLAISTLALPIAAGAALSEYANT
jgi:hypothetical protein